MKTNGNIPPRPAKTIASRLAHRLFVRVFAIFCIVGVGAAVVAKPASKKVATKLKKAEAPPARVLVIGDSLSVANFGEVLRDYLVSRFGEKNVSLYASCGSSPQSWLRSEPDFVTRCGFREHTPRKNAYIDFHDGKPPAHVRTPKVEDLLASEHPTIVLVQLGTNWMDGITAAPSAKEPEYRDIAHRFVRAIRQAPSVERIVWITPPDSSHFSQRVQRTVESIIKEVVPRRSDLVISSALTHYVSGKTGGDGVHYNKEASAEWARNVAGELNTKLP